MTTVICLRCRATSTSADARFCRVCGARLPRIPRDDQRDDNQPTLHSAPTLLQTNSATPANAGAVLDDDPLGLAATGDEDAIAHVQPSSLPSRSPLPSRSRLAINVPKTRRAPLQHGTLNPRDATLYRPAPLPPASSKAKTFILYAIGILLAASLGVWFALRVQTENSDIDDTTTLPAETTPITTPNDAPPPNLIAMQLAAAADLLSRGDAPRAIELLRLVIASDAKNSQAYLQLGEALEIVGKRNEAIAAYADAARHAPELVPPLQRLAAAYFTEGKFAEAAANYRQLLALPAAKMEVDDALMLRAAEAYRLAGETDDARKLLRLLAASKTATTRDLARRTLTELDSFALLTSPSPAPNASPTESPKPENVLPNPSPTPKASPAPPSSLPPAERYRRAVQTWTRDRASALPELRAVAGEIPEANYYLGLSFAEGRDPRDLNRAELVAALRHFQLARNTRFSQQSRRYEAQLTAEYDKRNDER